MLCLTVVVAVIGLVGSVVEEVEPEPPVIVEEASIVIAGWEVEDAPSVAEEAGGCCSGQRGMVDWGG